MKSLNWQASASSFSEQIALLMRISLGKISDSNLGRQGRMIFFKEINQNIMASVKNNPSCILQIKFQTQAFGYWGGESILNHSTLGFEGNWRDSHWSRSKVDLFGGVCGKADNWVIQGLLNQNLRAVRKNCSLDIVKQAHQIIHEYTNIWEPPIYLIGRPRAWKWWTWTIVSC